MEYAKNQRFSQSPSLSEESLIERLGRFDGSTEQFLADVLAGECFLGEAQAGAVLFNNQDSDVRVLAVHPAIDPEAGPPKWLTRAAESVPALGEADAVSLSPLDQDAGLPGSNAGYLVMIPTELADLGRVIAAFVVVGDRAVVESRVRKLRLSMKMVAYVQSALEQQAQRGGLERLKQAMEVLVAINSQPKFVGAAMAFCNEVASQWQCERASLGFLEGKYVRLEAMSHTEDFSRKMKVVQDIESTMEECLDQDIEILSPASQEATYVSRAAAELARRHGPLSVLSLPLRHQGVPAAVLTLERNAERAFTPEEVETIRLTCELCTARLVNLHEHNRWIGARIASKGRQLAADLVGPKYTVAKVITVLVMAGLAFITFAKGQFRPEAPFTLEATQQQVIPAPFDGYIKSVEVEVGDRVEANKSTLGTLDTAELRLQLAAAKAEKAGYLKQVAAAMRDNETAQAQIAQANADQADAQIDLLNYQIERAHLVSPISGIVVKGDLKKEIGAPVKTGDVLFEVCPIESLRAELMVPEDLILFIKPGQKGTLATASYPGRPIKFVVDRINPMAEAVKQRNVFRVRVRLLETHPWMRPGMEGVARVSVGKRRYIWIWTRKVTNWLRMKLWL